MSHKNEFLGFLGLNDFLNSFLGLGTIKLNTLIAALAGLTSFITGYIWESQTAIYFLWTLMFADWVTGVIKAAKTKELRSSRLFRMPIYFVATSAVVAFSWWMAKENILFTPLPSVILGGFYSVYFISFLENLGDLELLPKALVSALKARFGLKSIIEKFSKTEDGKPE